MHALARHIRAPDVPGRYRPAGPYGNGKLAYVGGKRVRVGGKRVRVGGKHDDYGSAFALSTAFPVR